MTSREGHGIYEMIYSDFYLSWIKYAKNNSDTLVGNELEHQNNSINNILNGKTHGQLVPEYGLDIIWPTEEATLLRILDNVDVFYEQILDFIK